jgi:hypothetical protein
MMRWLMVICEIIRQNFKTWAAVDVRLALFHLILDPIKAHIHGFCAFLLNCTIALTRGSGISVYIGVGAVGVPILLMFS